MKILVLLMSLAAFLLVTLPGPLYRSGLVELGAAFAGFKYAVITGIAALILLIVQMLFKRQTVTFTSAAVAIVFSLIAILMPLRMMSTANSVPAIHDISTDIMTPPEFVAIAPLRADAPNPTAYAGLETAEKQREAYPELQTLQYSQPKSELVAAVEQVANNLGWELVNIDANAGIVEATDTTTWFGFKDDVVVRVTDDGNERLVDIRSKSRIGKSDLGKNAERIRSFIKELDGVLGE
ncbi:DUF1499 domain-containing protein [Psychrobacter sp. Ps3]|uniref:DUF1499 domain-containing protein n=1 Tax=Psychrobacter sp. Ps3 TaxID=2790957 RepID=UPI001EDDC903|nr:DUF1499 domain-containing protein [Psychrobacter sp. Ps3]MCG3882279.1 DUF1499 domain-containing protein [Psychrobacter sp. Ps3]